MKKVFRFTLLILLTVAAVSCKKDKESEDSNPTKNNPYLNPNLTYGSVTDIDGNKYATIQIGNQVWMAENLKTTKYNDGTTIPNVTDNTAWTALTTSAWCYYNNDSKHNNIYGKLYNAYAVESDKLCPKGWHVPTKEEWNELRGSVGGESGKKLKSAGTIEAGTGLWYSYTNYEGTNSSGFTAVPGGFRAGGFDEFKGDGISKNLGFDGVWWSSSSSELYGTISRYVIRAWYDDYATGVDESGFNRDGFSCRCVKD